MGCPAWSTGCGRQSRGTRPRWISGQHLFHLLVGSYQQYCHPHWTGEGRREKTERNGHSLQSLRKHACFCLSCKRKLGSLSGRAFAFHKAHRCNFVMCDRNCLYFWWVVKLYVAYFRPYNYILYCTCQNMKISN